MPDGTGLEPAPHMRQRQVVSGARSGRGSRAVLLLRKAWVLGGARERLFVAMFILVYGIGVLVLLALLWMSSKAAWPFSTVIAALMAVWSLPAFQQAWLANMYCPRFFREGIREGWLPEDWEYYSELARYAEAHGTRGHLPGDLAWGLAYCGAYFGMIGLGVLVVLAAAPVFGAASWLAFVPIEASVAIGAFVAYGRRSYRVYQEAERRGFPLLRLSPRHRGKVPETPPRDPGQS